MAAILEASTTRKACDFPGRETLDEAKRQLKRTLTDIRHNAEDAATEASLAIRRHPFKAVGRSLAAGAIAGALIGFAVGWYQKARE